MTAHAAAGPRAAQIARAWATPAAKRERPAGIPRDLAGSRLTEEPARPRRRGMAAQGPIGVFPACRSRVRSPHSRRRRTPSHGAMGLSRSRNAGSRRGIPCPAGSPADNGNLQPPKGWRSQWPEWRAKSALVLIEREKRRMFNPELSLLSSGRGFVFSRRRL